MSEALTREQVEFHIGQIKYGYAESVADHADVIAANDAVQRATIQRQAQQIESLESTNRIAALALAEKEAEVARLKHAQAGLQAELAQWQEFTQRDVYQALVDARAEIARLKQDVNDLNAVLRNHGLAQGEIDAEASIDWKAEAQWAARRVGVSIITKDDHQRAQRILEEA